MGYIVIIKYSLSGWLSNCPQHSAEQQQPTWVLLYYWLVKMKYKMKKRDSTAGLTQYPPGV